MDIPLQQILEPFLVGAIAGSLALLVVIVMTVMRGGHGPLFARPLVNFLSKNRIDDRSDLRLMVASDGNTENEIIRKFEREFESNKKKCPVLIVRAPNDSEKWTIAGFSDWGEFRTVVIDDPNQELSKELKKEPANQSRIVELATSSLGRTPDDNTSSRGMATIRDYVLLNIITIMLSTGSR